MASDIQLIRCVNVGNRFMVHLQRVRKSAWDPPAACAKGQKRGPGGARTFNGGDHKNRDQCSQETCYSGTLDHSACRDQF
jgi:hypothetical protein